MDSDDIGLDDIICVLQHNLWSILDCRGKRGLLQTSHRVRQQAALLVETLDFSTDDPDAEESDLLRLFRSLSGSFSDIRALRVQSLSHDGCSCLAHILDSMRDEGCGTLNKIIKVICTGEDLPAYGSRRPSIRSRSYGQLSAAILGAFPKLCQLHLQWIDMGTASRAFPQLAACPNLRHLRLVQNWHSGLPLDAVSSLQSLTHLALLMRLAQPMAAPQLTPSLMALSHLTGLHHLEVSMYWSGRVELHDIPPAFSTLTRLTHLNWDLEHRLWGRDTDPFSTMTALSMLRDLHELHLGNMNLTDAGLQLLTALPALSALRVWSLQLSGAPPSQGLLALRRLQAMMEVGPVQLLQLLGANRSLTELHLPASRCVQLHMGARHNPVSDNADGMAEVGRALGRLLSLPVDWGDLVLQELGAAQRHCGMLCHLAAASSPIRSLRLCGAKSRWEDLEVLLVGCPMVSELRLEMCDLDAGALLPLLGLPHLQYLSLYHCSVNEAQVASYCRQVTVPLKLACLPKELYEAVKKLLRGHATCVELVHIDS